MRERAESKVTPKLGPEQVGEGGIIYVDEQVSGKEIKNSLRHFI